MTFDRVIMVDWSAAATPRPAGRDAIWIGSARPGADEDEPLHVPTRLAAEARLGDAVAAVLASGERLLVGCDFAFGYPEGFAASLTGVPDVFAVWTWLGARLRDGPDNANNRFDVAAAMNRALGGRSPFWGRPRGYSDPDLPARRPGAPFPNGIAADRRVEAHLRGYRGPGRAVKSLWQIAYAGSVGSQALTGIPILGRLRSAFSGRVAVWPFEPAGRAQIVLAEIYPALIDPALRREASFEPIRDRGQVRLMARAVARLVANGRQDRLFALPAGASEAVCREEGWILGATEPELLGLTLA